MSLRRAVAFLSASRQRWTNASRSPSDTHILCLNLDFAFTQRILNVLIFSPFMAPKTFDQIIQGFFEPTICSGQWLIWIMEPVVLTLWLSNITPRCDIVRASELVLVKMHRPRCSIGCRCRREATAPRGGKSGEPWREIRITGPAITSLESYRPRAVTPGVFHIH